MLHVADICFITDSKIMAYTRTVSNSRIADRWRQVLVLVSTIVVGMLVSVFINF